LAIKIITGKVVGPDGGLKAATIVATLSQPTIIAGTQETVPSVVKVTAAPDGTYSISLQANNDMTPNGTYYTVAEVAPDGGYYAFTIIVPQTAGPFVMSNLIGPVTPVNIPVNAHVATLLVDGAVTFSGGPISLPNNSIADVALSANVTLNNAIQTVSAVKTFTATPVFNAGATFASGQVVMVGTGDEIGLYAPSNQSPPQLFEAVVGTAGAPNTTVGPVLKLNKTEQILESQLVNGSTNEQNAALTVMTKNTALSEVQTVAGVFTSQTQSTQSSHNDDACAVLSIGRVIGSGTGYGIGGYFDGRRDTSTGHANGLEVRASNYTAVDGSFNPTGASDTMGLWLSSGGTSTGGGATLGGVLNGVALSMFGLANTQWDVGIGIPAGSVKSHSFYDNSSSLISLRVSGTHATAAVAVGDTAGSVVIGSTSAQTPKFTITGTYSDATGAIATYWNLNHSISAAGKQTILMGGSVTLTAAIAGSHLFSAIAPVLTSNPTNDPTKTLVTLYGQFVRLDTAAAYTAAVTSLINVYAQGSNHAGSGTISSLHHFRVGNSGVPTGTITSEIGLYIEALTRGVTNRSIYLAGNSGAVAPPIEFQNGGSIIVDTTNGLTFGTGSNQKLGWYGATPVVQIAGATDLLAGLVTQGLRAASVNPPLNLGTGALTVGSITFSGSLSATAGSVVDSFIGTDTWVPADYGFKTWAFDPALVQSTQPLTPAGTAFVVKLHLREATTITNIVAFLGVVGNTLTAGQCFAALYDGSRNLKSATADQSANWVGALGIKTMALGAAQAMAAGDCYVAFYYNGTTGPAFYRGVLSNISNINLSNANARFATADTGLTTAMPGTLAALVAFNANYWVALN
jgi:hypothetical protein